MENQENLFLKEYMKFTDTVAMYLPHSAYLPCLIASEAGEVVGKMSKMIRDEWDEEKVKKEVCLELGDVVWACIRIGMDTNLLGISRKKTLVNFTEIIDRPCATFISKLNYERFIDLGMSLNETALRIAKQVLHSNNRGEFTVSGMNMVDVSNLEDRLYICLYTVGKIGATLGLSLRDIVKANIEKLSARLENKTIQGSGDHR